MAAPNHAHDLESFDGGIGRSHCLEASHGTDHPFETTMIGFNDVVEVLGCSMACMFGKLAFTMQPTDCLWVRAELIGGDRVRRPMGHRVQRLAQKPIGGARVPPVQQHEVDQPSLLVDGAKQILPLAADPNIGFIHPPRSER